MKQIKAYIKHLGLVSGVTAINYLDKEVEVYNKQNAVFDDSSTGFDVYAFDEVEFIYGTGFKDKNGKEIESGDILKTEFEDVFTIKFNNVYGFCAIEGDVRYWFADENLMYELREALSKSEVIGNVYENKDLLEE